MTGRRRSADRASLARVTAGDSTGSQCVGHPPQGGLSTSTCRPVRLSRPQLTEPKPYLFELNHLGFMQVLLTPGRFPSVDLSKGCGLCDAKPSFLAGQFEGGTPFSTTERRQKCGSEVSWPYLCGCG
jgi:hypothetical protein